MGINVRDDLTILLLLGLLLAAAVIFRVSCWRLFQLQAQKKMTATIAGFSGAIGFVLSIYFCFFIRHDLLNLFGLIGMVWFIGSLLSTILYALAPRLDRKL